MSKVAFGVPGGIFQSTKLEADCTSLVPDLNWRRGSEI
jgi:hypothetical protein